MAEKIYLNLTNGIEYLEEFPNASFIRIPSTWCEQKLWEQLLWNLDSDFLLNVAIGNICIIYDKSANKIVPRSLYQGVKWIDYVLNRIWFNREINVYVRCHNSKTYFREEYKRLGRGVRRKIKYFKKFLLTSYTRIGIVSDITSNDGNYEFYQMKIKEVTDGKSK